MCDGKKLNAPEGLDLDLDFVGGRTALGQFFVGGICVMARKNIAAKGAPQKLAVSAVLIAWEAL